MIDQKDTLHEIFPQPEAQPLKHEEENYLRAYPDLERPGNIVTAMYIRGKHMGWISWDPYQYEDLIQKLKSQQNL